MGVGICTAYERVCEVVSATHEKGEDDDRPIRKTKFIDQSSIQIEGRKGTSCATLHKPLEKLPISREMWVIAVPSEVASRDIHHTLCTTSHILESEWINADPDNAFVEKVDCGDGVYVFRDVCDWDEEGEGWVCYNYRAGVSEECVTIPDDYEYPPTTSVEDERNKNLEEKGVEGLENETYTPYTSDNEDVITDDDL